MPTPSLVRRDQGQTPVSGVRAVAGACLWALLAALPVPVLLAQSPPAWTLTRDLRIDAAERDLSPISWIAVAPNGTIVVNQAQDGQLRFFDARGADLGTFGRKGQGPGEFEAVNRVGWFGDTMWVSDLRTRRYTLVSPDRALVRTLPWPTTLTGELTPDVTSRTIRSSIPLALLPDGSHLLSLSVGDSPSGDVPGNGVPIARADRDGKLERLIAWRPDDGCTVSVTMSGGFGMARVPFCFISMNEASPRGDRFAMVHAEASRGRDGAYRVSVVQTAADTIFSRSYSYRRVPVPRYIADSVQQSLQRRAGRGPEEFRSAWRSMTVPSDYPPIDRLLLGRDNTTWLEEYTPSGDRSWLVLDARGEPVGRASVPRTVRILVPSREALWGTDTDDDGLQHIVRFTVRAR